MGERTGTRLGVKQVLVLAALLAVALSLRPQLIGVGPLIPLIRVDLDLSFAVAGLLATIPVLCMGVFALAAGSVFRHLGSYRGVAVAVAAIGGFGLLRAAAPEAATLLLSTVGLGVGMALGGALLPVVVRERFSGRVGLATGTYVTGLRAGAALSAATAVPLAQAVGGWRAALAVFSAVTVVLAGVWLALARDGPHEKPASRPQRLPLRSPLAWVLIGLFAILSLEYYGISAWLAAAYVERGWSEASAGGLVGTLNAAAIPSGFFASWASDRVGRTPPLILGSVLGFLALFGFAAFPDGAWAWALLFGLGNGSLLALMLTLPVDAGRDTREVAAYTAMMLAGGYALTAFGPVALGAVRDVTGSFAASLWLLVVLAGLFALGALAYARWAARQAPAAH